MPFDVDTILDQTQHNMIDPTTYVNISGISFLNVSSEGLFGGSFECGIGGGAPCTNITLEHVHLNVSRGGCEFSQTTGVASDVFPASCIPPTKAS